MYPVEFYQDQNKQNPVRDFLLSLQSKPRGKVEKRSQKLPQREIRIAMERMNADRKRKEG